MRGAVGLCLQLRVQTHLSQMSKVARTTVICIARIAVEGNTLLPLIFGGQHAHLLDVLFCIIVFVPHARGMLARGGKSYRHSRSYPTHDGNQRILGVAVVPRHRSHRRRGRATHAGLAEEPMISLPTIWALRDSSEQVLPVSSRQAQEGRRVLSQHGAGRPGAQWAEINQPHTGKHGFCRVARRWV